MSHCVHLVCYYPISRNDPSGHETVIYKMTCEEKGGTIRIPGQPVQDPISSITQEDIDVAVAAYGESISYGLNFIRQIFAKRKSTFNE